MSLLNVSELSICYDNINVVDSLSFTLEAGESLSLVGESGSGKSQTALAILGLLPRNAIVSGSIVFAEQQIVGASDRELDRLRAQRIAMVFQDPTQALNPYLRVGKQLRRILLRHEAIGGREADSRVVDMLAKVGLPDPARQSRAYPHQLSGGMRQRAMIAAALITNPDILIADEPTTALDVTVQAQILELLDTFREHTALLLITHDLGVVAGYAERMLVLQDGREVEAGTTRKVFASPQHEHTKVLLAAAPRLERAQVPQALTSGNVLAVNAASVSYREPGYGRLMAVRDVDLTLKQAETLSIVGESGSGKSSLARAILGLVPTDTGSISFCGKTLETEVRARAKATRRELQLVFQNPVGSLNPQMRVAAIVGEPLTVHERNLGRASVRERVSGMLKQVGLNAEYIDRYPHELSGGQAQRVAIARALILEPTVLVCDEAVAALDGSVREQILELLREIQARTGLSILFISHDLGVVRAISHRVLVMYLGRLTELADNAKLFATPRHPYTRALIDAVPLPNPEAAKRSASLKGEVPSILSPPEGCVFHPRCRYANDRCKREMPPLSWVGEAAVACHRSDELIEYLATGLASAHR